MQVELLVSPGCLALRETEGWLKVILSELAPEGMLQMIVVDSLEKARALKFPGSPTIRVNGKDIDPGADTLSEYGLG